MPLPAGQPASEDLSRQRLLGLCTWEERGASCSRGGGLGLPLGLCFGAGDTQGLWKGSVWGVEKGVG